MATAPFDDAASLVAALTGRQQLLEWAAGAELLALVRACGRAGWLAELTGPVDADELARRLRLSPSRVDDVLQALLAGGVVTCEDDRYALGETFAALAGDASGLGLETVLAAVDVHRRHLDELVRGVEATIDAETALTIARSAGPRPTDGALEVIGAVYGSLAPLQERWAAGGRHLDVGCGVGGALLSAARLYPQLRAVGLELVPEVAEEARRRARDAGVADRVEIRSLDARELTEREAFDVAFWAQPFFRADSRADVLASIHRALAPDGLLVMQELHPPPAAGGSRSAQAALDRAVDRSLGLAGETSAEQLVAEASAAGFTHVLTESTMLGRMVLMRRP